MATFSKNESVDIDVSIEVDVFEFFEEMDDTEKKEMKKLLKDDIDPIDIIESKEDKQAFYKEFAYAVGNSDSLNLDFFIEELQYWSKK